MSVYGLPGTGKTLTTRRLCREFSACRDDFGYVNLMECRTLFSVANEIHMTLSGTQKQAYEGLDGVFTGIWEALETYQEWTVLILDEIDHIQHASHYDPNDFFYRLLRGEGKLERELNLSLFLISNELIEVDLRLDSRVQSAMSDVEVYFPHYDAAKLDAAIGPRLEQAFQDGALPAEVRTYGMQQAADRWGDTRKTLTLFRQAVEMATEYDLEHINFTCIDRHITSTEREPIIEKIEKLPFNHARVLAGITGWRNRERGEIVQPVTTAEVASFLEQDDTSSVHSIGKHVIHEILSDLETMTLVETETEVGDSGGEVKQIWTTFDPQWVRDAAVPTPSQFDKDVDGESD